VGPNSKDVMWTGDRGMWDESSFLEYNSEDVDTLPKRHKRNSELTHYAVESLTHLRRMDRHQ
jgi:hypothetical protein